MRERIKRLALLGLSVVTVSTSAIPVMASDLTGTEGLQIVAEEGTGGLTVVESEQKDEKGGDAVTPDVKTEVKSEVKTEANPEVKPSTEVKTDNTEVNKTEKTDAPEVVATDKEIEFEVPSDPQGAISELEKGSGTFIFAKELTITKGTIDDIKAGTELEVTKLEVEGAEADKTKASAEYTELEDGSPAVMLSLDESLVTGGSGAKADTISVSAEVSVTAKTGYTVPTGMKLSYDLNIKLVDPAPVVKEEVKLVAKTTKPSVTFSGEDVKLSFEYDVEGINADTTGDVLKFKAEKFALNGKEIPGVVVNAVGDAVATKVDVKKHTVKVTYTLDKDVLLRAEITEGTYDGQLTVTPELTGAYEFSADSNIDATKLRVFTLKSTVKAEELPGDEEGVFTIPAWSENDTDKVSMTFTGEKDIVYDYSFAGAPEFEKKLTEFLAVAVSDVRINDDTVSLSPRVDTYDNGKNDRGVTITFNKDKLKEAGLKNGDEAILSWRIVFSSADADIKVAGEGTIDDGAFKFKYAVNEDGSEAGTYVLEMEKWGESDKSKPSYTFRGDKDIEYKYTINLDDIGEVPYDFTEYMDAKVTGVYLNNKVCKTTPKIAIAKDGNQGIVTLTFSKEDIIAMGFQRHARPILEWDIEFTSKKDDVQIIGEGTTDKGGFMFDYQYQTGTQVDAQKQANSGATQAPKTGDTTNAASASMTMLGAMVVMAGVLKKRKDCFQ